MTPRREDLMASEIAGRLAGCPTAEELQRFQEGTLTSDARRAIERHAGRCAPCSAGLLFLGQARADADQDAVELPAAVEHRSERLIESVAEMAPRPTFAPRVPVLVACALVVALVVLTVVALWALPAPGVPAGETTVQTRLQPVEPLGRQPSPPREFRWTPDPRASRYRVILHEAGQPDLRLDTRDAVPVLVLDWRTRERLGPGVDYSWTVAALDPAGEEIERSREVRFALTARNP